MKEHNRAGDRVLQFPRRWHVLQDIDLARLLSGHDDLARLCDELEICADALPTLPDATTIERLCDVLDEQALRLERSTEPAIADLLGHDPANPITAPLVRRIRMRREGDAAHARDVIAALRPCGDGRAPPAAETLGYMLRCFFGGCRRAIDLEQLAFLGLAGHRLTPDARAMLTAHFGRSLP
jgi:hypothetical protein